MFQNYETLVDYFGEFDGDMVLLVKHSEGGNLLTPENMNVLYEIWVENFNATLDYKGRTWTFDDLCAKEYNSKREPCQAYMSGLFAIFNFDPTAWSDPDSIQWYIDNYIYYMQVMY